MMGITIAINGRWWSVYGQDYPAVVEILVHSMGVGLALFSIYYASYAIKDIRSKKASKAEKA